MTQAHSPASEPAQLPTIIIDPSLYAADVPLPKQSARAGLGRLARVTLLTSAVGGATVGLSHLPWSDSFPHDLEVASLTKLIRQVDHATASHSALPDDRRVPLAQAAKSAAPALPGAEAGLNAEAAAAAAVTDEGPSPIELAPEALAAPVAAAPVGEPPQAVIKQALVGPNRLRVGAARPDLETNLRNARRLHALNQLEGAAAAYQAVLDQHAEQSTALVGLARIHLAWGQLEAALELAQRAVLATPDQPNVHLTLGDILRARGDLQGAQAEYALAK
jgi:tetratricopeptide (TPR) repeat protein